MAKAVSNPSGPLVGARSTLAPEALAEGMKGVVGQNPEGSEGAMAVA